MKKFNIIILILIISGNAFACNFPIPLIWGYEYYEMSGCELSTTFYFDGSESYDYLGNLPFCEWSFPAGAINVNIWGEHNEYASCRFNVPGTLHVYLDVVDEEGTYSEYSAECVVYVSPGKCNNCHTIQDIINECGHYQFDTHCRNDFCIINLIETATCDWNLNTNCPSTCTAREVYPFPPPQVYQQKVDLNPPNCPTGGQPVQLHLRYTIYTNCPNCCIQAEILSACEIPDCDGVPSGEPQPRGRLALCSGNCQF